MPETTTDEVNALERRLKKLEDGKGRDGWEILQALASVVGAIAVPLVLTFVGGQVSQRIADADRAATAATERAAQVAAEAEFKLKQAELIGTFTQSLLSNDPAEQALAAKAVTLALPDYGPELLDVIASSAQASPEARRTAVAALDELAPRLEQELQRQQQQVTKLKDEGGEQNPGLRSAEWNVQQSQQRLTRIRSMPRRPLPDVPPP